MLLGRSGLVGAPGPRGRRCAGVRCGPEACWPPSGWLVGGPRGQPGGCQCGPAQGRGGRGRTVVRRRHCLAPVAALGAAAGVGLPRHSLRWPARDGSNPSRPRLPQRRFGASSARQTSRAGCVGNLQLMDEASQGSGQIYCSRLYGLNCRSNGTVTHRKVTGPRPSTAQSRSQGGSRRRRKSPRLLPLVMCNSPSCNRQPEG